MQIQTLKIKNFRHFGPEGFTLKFRRGLTVLVGENDAGKSAIIDALRYAMGTTDMRWNHILPSDVFDSDLNNEIWIQVCFNNLNEDESASLLEYLTYGQDGPVVYLNWSCHFNLKFVPARPIVEITSGENGDGPTFIAEARELFRATYLKPLRDAYTDMQAGRGSRLSQVIRQIPKLDKGDKKYYEESEVTKLSLTGIFDLTNYLLEHFQPLLAANKQMNDILTQTMLLNGDQVETKLEVANSNISESQKILSLLEKIGLNIDHDKKDIYGVPGLGTSNIMSMACELLLQKQKSDSSQFTFIEEPEAHIHPQRQMKLIRSLESSANDTSHQIIVTSHSPLLASVVHLKNLVIVKSGRAYPMDPHSTKLSLKDYGFLERFLDATKANLFFANGVLIVEGSGEELLLPTLAKLIDRNLSDYGVSIVNVMSKGLIHFADIFKRSDGITMGIPVACITDRDIEPDVAPKILGQKSDDPNRHWRTENDLRQDASLLKKLNQRRENINEGNVKAFISDKWTLEYDLVLSSWANDAMRKALTNALFQATGIQPKTQTEWLETFDNAENSECRAVLFYKHVRRHKAEFANYLANELEQLINIDDSGLTLYRKFIPAYLVNAIEYVTGGNDEK
ncbi:ATP-dependent nuclease [Liquorilactobacillus satsumensis]|uniref:ATP-dependent nuclease n=1 Tax=Liquorilactobacillus TaxID=2767888 RepID=UPI0021C4B49B|nr:AAA family ATPase [Liquorilactobacillus satsumensis]MCP9329098.1 AAA family ATPase [Liquorilactobacillus satsumensis]